MQHIKNALEKARQATPGLGAFSAAPVAGTMSAGEAVRRPEVAPVPVVEEPAEKLRIVKLDPTHLERRRIIARSMKDPNHVSFNHLRTRVRKTMQDNGWTSLALTSPTPACGKTMVTLNLAFSLAREPGIRTVVVDLDLKKPAVASTLGVRPTGSIGRYLLGEQDARDCFVQVDPNLIVGLNAGHISASSELIQGARIQELFNYIYTALKPELVLFDLPPMKSTDDAIALLPHIDTALLVVAAGQTTTAEVDECELQMSELNKLLGVILNKSEDLPSKYYYY